MEHTFQEEIMSEISKYQTRINIIRKNMIPHNHEELDAEDLLLTTIQINEWNSSSVNAIEHYIDRIDMLRNEYATVCNVVCPV